MHLLLLSSRFDQRRLNKSLAGVLILMVRRGDMETLIMGWLALNFLGLVLVGIRTWLNSIGEKDGL